LSLEILRLEPGQIDKRLVVREGHNATAKRDIERIRESEGVVVRDDGATIEGADGMTAA
jgi:hypothetical protein